MANAQLNVQYIINRKGGHNFTFDGYIYRVNRRREAMVFWRCVERGCQAFLSTFKDIPTGFGRQNHNHPVDALRRRPIPTIVTEELTKLRDNE